jgi:4-amino-4-deoxy-L-arabinose transferase-like glycosyltransferase
MRPLFVAFAIRDPIRPLNKWSEAAALALIVLAIVISYTARLGLQPLVGEETRWGSGAREMLRTGDWVVPRQQGQVFPERPPMTMWLMAIGGYFRGDVDPIAVRLPSVIAIALTSLLVFAYARCTISPTAALIAAIVYASFGQVLQIGRLGESESVFALLVSASLFIWHLGYIREWPPLATWVAGFSLAALAALVKGPQAPVYFGAIITAYLCWRRDLPFLFRWQALAGGFAFAAIIAAWQIPFYRAAGWDASVAAWAGLAGDRLQWSGILAHVFSYPAETFVCLLPWSPMLIALLRPGARQMLADKQPIVAFLLVAIVVAYPTVWLAAGARGRYFMPLYPLTAVLIGLLIERCSQAAVGTSQRLAWRQFLVGWAIVTTLGALALAACGVLPGSLAASIYQPPEFCLPTGIVAMVAAALLWGAFARPARIAMSASIVALAGSAVLSCAGIKVNVNVTRFNNPVSAVAEFKQLVPSNIRLVSFSPAEHRFLYYFADPVTELGWPKTLADLPDDVEYFCFMRHPGDTAVARASGRGRTPYNTPGTLPFAWEEVKSICVDRQAQRNDIATVVLGRVIRPIRAQVSDATIPQTVLAQRPSATLIK